MTDKIRKYLLIICLSIWAFLGVLSTVKEHSEINKCEQNGLHCEMRAIPVMELKE